MKHIVYVPGAKLNPPSENRIIVCPAPVLNALAVIVSCLRIVPFVALPEIIASRNVKLFGPAVVLPIVQPWSLAVAPVVVIVMASVLFPP